MLLWSLLALFYLVMASPLIDDSRVSKNINLCRHYWQVLSPAFPYVDIPSYHLAGLHKHSFVNVTCASDGLEEFPHNSSVLFNYTTNATHHLVPGYGNIAPFYLHQHIFLCYDEAQNIAEDKDHYTNMILGLAGILIIVVISCLIQLCFRLGFLMTILNTEINRMQREGTITFTREDSPEASFNVITPDYASCHIGLRIDAEDSSN